MLTKLVDCPYLKDEIGRNSCKSCRNHTELKVFGCKQYGRCTISKELPGISCCKTCPLNKANSENTMSLSWMYGVTTVPSRKDNLLIQTLESLKLAGFTAPYIYVDGSYDGYNHIGPGLQKAGIICRFPSIGIYGNWLLSIWELYIRNPRADRYCLFQDDVIALSGLKDYLDSCSFPEKGYLNLFSSTPQNEVLLTTKGWIPSNQMGRAALGLVFSNQGIKDLLLNQSSLKYEVEKPTWAGKLGNRNVDGFVVDVLKTLGYIEFIHNPSLLQHTGDRSTIGNPPTKAKTFNPNFNLVDLLK